MSRRRRPRLRWSAANVNLPQDIANQALDAAGVEFTIGDLEVEPLEDGLVAKLLRYGTEGHSGHSNSSGGGSNVTIVARRPWSGKRAR